MGQLFSTLWARLFGTREYKIVMVRCCRQDLRAITRGVRYNGLESSCREALTASSYDLR